MYSISIIIPVKAINGFTRESLGVMQKLDYPEYETLIFPDTGGGEVFPGTRVIATGPIGPAKKRDLALKYAKGDILAFIDGDAYPHPGWFKKAIIHFDNPRVGAVGGPAVTPASDSIRQQASGEAYASWLVSGQYAYRYRAGHFREVDDYPSANLLIRKNAFARIGGFDSDYYPGEDTKLCLDLTSLGYKIIYEPGAVVYHHRRPVFKAHLRQVANYAFHRGNFAKVLPKTSRKLAYFVPSFFVLFVMLFPFIGKMYAVYLSVLTLYLLLVAAAVMRIRRFPLAILTAITIVSTHFTYGIYFIKGLLTKQLER